MYAHFGEWDKAAGAWSDALDTLLGPYQVRSAGGPVWGGARCNDSALRDAAWSRAPPPQQPARTAAAPPTFHRPQVAASWRVSELASRPPADLLRAYGAHGLLLAGGALAGKLLRFPAAPDRGRALSAARLAAHLVGALFACDLGHPQRPVDFAVHTPEEIWPGADLWGTDSHR